jgi:curved DNA-binding protein
MEYKDYYKIMGLDKKASQDDIKRAYRKLARKYHPDVSKQADAEAKFKELGEAYEVLKDTEKRAAYDQLGSNWKSGQDFRPPPGWEGGFRQAGGEHASQADFSDFFEELFGQARKGRGRQGPWQAGPEQGFNMQGEDRHARILIDIEDSYKGVTRQLSLQIPEMTAEGRVHQREKTLSVKIPKGIRAGQQIRLAGQGGPGMGKGPAGDLYLEVGFKPHPRYRAEGKDIYFDVPVAPWEAALGDSVSVDTPGGSLKLKIPANAQSGKTLRLKGGGLPGKSPGDLYAVLNIVNPPAESEEARAAFRKLQDSLAFNPRVAREV